MKSQLYKSAVCQIISKSQRLYARSVRSNPSMEIQLLHDYTLFPLSHLCKTLLSVIAMQPLNWARLYLSASFLPRHRGMAFWLFISKCMRYLLKFDKLKTLNRCQVISETRALIWDSKSFDISSTLVRSVPTGARVYYNDKFMHQFESCAKRIEVCNEFSWYEYTKRSTCKGF